MVEAWVALAAVVCLLVLAPVAGLVAGTRVDDTLQRAVREQAQARRQVSAVVLHPPKEPPADPAAGTAGGAGGSESAPSGQSGPYPRVLAEWTAPDGTARTGPVTTVDGTPKPGDRLRIWTDRTGRPVSRPLDPVVAAAYAGLAGFAAAGALALLVDTVRRLVVRRLMHHRYARLDRAWAAAGPDWGRADAGS